MTKITDAADSPNSRQNQTVDKQEPNKKQIGNFKYIFQEIPIKTKGEKSITVNRGKIHK